MHADGAGDGAGAEAAPAAAAAPAMNAFLMRCASMPSRRPSRRVTTVQPIKRAARFDARTERLKTHNGINIGSRRTRYRRWCRCVDGRICRQTPVRLTCDLSPVCATQEVENHGTRVAFISTPSVYFSLKKGSALSRDSMVFDVRGVAVVKQTAARSPSATADDAFRTQVDTRWAAHANFIAYNFEEPENVPSELHHTARVLALRARVGTQAAGFVFALTCNVLRSSTSP